MLLNFKKLFVLLSIFCLINACSFSEEKSNQKQESTDSAINNIPVLELTEEQQSAFDALNTLQTKTDEMNRLYSTFANINQPCYPADTSFEVSQSELLMIMQQFISKHCQNLNPEIQGKLAQTAVLAQKKYTVLHCTENISTMNYEKEFSMTGIWVLPNILGRRDLTLVW